MKPKTASEASPTRAPRMEVNTRMPVPVAEMLSDASSRTGQTQTSIVVDAVQFYCGKTTDDPDLHLRRAAVLTALHGAGDTDAEASAVRAALTRLAAAVGRR